MKLEVQLDTDRVAPGEEVTGSVLVHEGGRSRALTLTVSFRESSPSYQSAPFSQSAVLHNGDLATGQAVEFRCELPDWVAPGVNGKHGELYWELEVVSDAPGFDTRTRRRFDVVAAPQG